MYVFWYTVYVTKHPIFVHFTLVHVSVYGFQYNFSNSIAIHSTTVLCFMHTLAFMINIHIHIMLTSMHLLLSPTHVVKTQPTSPSFSVKEISYSRKGQAESGCHGMGLYWHKIALCILFWKTCKSKKRYIYTLYMHHHLINLCVHVCFGLYNEAL